MIEFIYKHEKIRNIREKVAHDLNLKYNGLGGVGCLTMQQMGPMAVTAMLFVSSFLFHYIYIYRLIANLTTIFCCAGTYPPPPLYYFHQRR